MLSLKPNKAGTFMLQGKTQKNKTYYPQLLLLQVWGEPGGERKPCHQNKENELAKSLLKEKKKKKKDKWKHRGKDYTYML